MFWLSSMYVFKWKDQTFIVGSYINCCSLLLLSCRNSNCKQCLAHWRQSVRKFFFILLYSPFNATIALLIMLSCNLRLLFFHFFFPKMNKCSAHLPTSMSCRCSIKFGMISLFYYYCCYYFWAFAGYETIIVMKSYAEYCCHSAIFIAAFFSCSLIRTGSLNA